MTLAPIFTLPSVFVLNLPYRTLALFADYIIILFQCAKLVLKDAGMKRFLVKILITGAFGAIKGLETEFRFALW